MTTTAIVWLVVALLTITVALALLVALLRHLLVVGRSAARFQEEVTAVTGEIAEASERARSRSPRGRRDPS